MTPRPSPLGESSGPRRIALQAAIAIGLAAALILAIVGFDAVTGDEAATPDSLTASSLVLAAPSTAVVPSPTTTAPPATTPVVTAPVTTPATTPVTVVSPTVAPTVLPTTPVPAVDAAAYVVYDPASGETLAELGADDRRAVGSTMKLLGVYVGMQAGDPDRLATVPALDLDAAESSIGLREGEQYSRALLMRAMLIVSANDAARTLAVDVAGSEAAFVEQMNAAAASLGLTNTAAANPVGLDDPAAYSSARDLAALAAVLMNDATFRETVTRRSAKLHGTTFAATNKLLGTYEGADGVKTGRTTQAGWCVVASATRDGRRFIVVVLGASSDEARFASASALLDWAFEQ